MSRLSLNTTNIKTSTPVGTDYECRTPQEASHLLKSGISSSRILYAEACTSPYSLRFAARNGIDAVVADSQEALMKIRAHHPRARVVLRVNASQSVYRRDAEFTDASEVASDMVELATSLGLNVAGVRFHVGSDSDAYEIYLDSKHMTSPMDMRSPVYLRSPSFSSFSSLGRRSSHVMVQ